MNQDTLKRTIRAINETIAKSQYLLEKLTEMRSELVIYDDVCHVVSEPTEQETSEATVRKYRTVESTPTPQDLFPDIVTADLETVKRKCRYIIDTFGREQHRQPLLDLVHYHAEEKSLTKATPEELQRIYDDVCHYEQKIGRDDNE